MRMKRVGLAIALIVATAGFAFAQEEEDLPVFPELGETQAVWPPTGTPKPTPTPEVCHVIIGEFPTCIKGDVLVPVDLYKESGARIRFKFNGWEPNLTRSEVVFLITITGVALDADGKPFDYLRTEFMTVSAQKPGGYKIVTRGERLEDGVQKPFEATRNTVGTADPDQITYLLWTDYLGEFTVNIATASSTRCVNKQDRYRRPYEECTTTAHLEQFRCFATRHDFVVVTKDTKLECKEPNLCPTPSPKPATPTPSPTPSPSPTPPGPTPPGQTPRPTPTPVPGCPEKPWIFHRGAMVMAFEQMQEVGFDPGCPDLVDKSKPFTFYYQKVGGGPIDSFPINPNEQGTTKAFPLGVDAGAYYFWYTYTNKSNAFITSMKLSVQILPFPKPTSYTPNPSSPVVLTLNDVPVNQSQVIAAGGYGVGFVPPVPRDQLRHSGFIVIFENPEVQFSWSDVWANVEGEPGQSKTLYAGDYKITPFWDTGGPTQFGRETAFKVQ